MATQRDENTGPTREEPTPELRAQRSESRSAQTYAFFLRDLEARGLERKLAEQAIPSVLCVMEQRLMSGEARHLEAQLPRKVVALLERCPKHLDKPYGKFGRDELLRMVAEDLGVGLDEAERITCAVLATVREHITEGEAQDVLGQLPKDLRSLWEPSGPGAQKPGARGRRRSARRRIEEVMTRQVQVVGPEDTLRAAAEKMRSLDVGPLPVCEGDKLLGIITDRDIVVRAVAQGLDPGSTRVSQAMSGPVQSVFQDESLEAAVRKMRQEKIRRILVVDRDQKLVGIVSLGDIAEAISEKEAGQTLEAISEHPQPLPH